MFNNLFQWYHFILRTSLTTPHRDVKKGYEGAASLCASMGGHVVEINSQAEADFLQEISNHFLIGAKKDMNTGLWHWETTGEVIDSTKFLMLSPGKEPKYHRATLTKGENTIKLSFNAFDGDNPTNDWNLHTIMGYL